MSKIKVAFVGTGYMANEYAKVLSKSFPYKNIIVGAINRSNPRIDDFIINYNVKKKFSNIDQMMREVSPDIVFVTVNELSAIKVIEKLSKYPCVCMIEKPAGVDYEESKKILLLKKNKKFFSFVGLNRRFYSSVINAKEVLKKDSSKRIIKICDQENIILAKKMGQPKKVLNNWMYANSIHLIDLAHFFGRGDITNIKTNNKKNFLQEGYLSSKLSFSSGDVVEYFCIWNRPAPWSLQISTNKYFLELKPIEEFSYLKNPSRKWINVKKSIKDKIYKPGIYLQTLNVFKFLTEKKSNIKDLDYSNKLMKLIKEIYFD